NSEGRVIASLCGGVRERKLTDEMRTAIRSWIDADCGLSLKSLAEKVEADFGLTVSKSTIDRCISAFNYSSKRKSLIPERRNCPSTIEKRKEYALVFNSLLACSETSITFILLMKLDLP
ncbi:hypothetical protein ENBRE01_3401, partial [Enteropsectra breve]